MKLDPEVFRSWNWQNLVMGTYLEGSDGFFEEMGRRGAVLETDSGGLCEA